MQEIFFFSEIFFKIFYFITLILNFTCCKLKKILNITQGIFFFSETFFCFYKLFGNNINSKILNMN